MVNTPVYEQDNSLKNTPNLGNCKLPPGLYIVGTPIGNLQDMTFRAIDTLKRVDVIACEDTRVTSTLTRHYGIATRLLAYHDHNADRVRPQLVKQIQEGKAIALVSDAGMPLVSDPGYKLVVSLREDACMVTCIPGPTAMITGLVLSGIPCDRFSFYGFMPEKHAARCALLESLRRMPYTTIFYESAKRLKSCLEDITQILPTRRISVARELTKKFEEVSTNTAGQLLTRYDAGTYPRGEIVLILEGSGKKVVDWVEIDQLLAPALNVLSSKDAAALVALQTGISKGDIYKRAIYLKESHGS